MRSIDVRHADPPTRARRHAGNAVQRPSTAAAYVQRDGAAIDAFSIAAELERLADERGDNRFRHAAAILRAPANHGRTPADDRAALEELDRLIAAGTRPNRAYFAIARQLAATQPNGPKVESIARRLKKKRHAQK